MKFALWLKWWLWDVRRCAHDPGRWIHVDLGMRKARDCTKCGKCIELL